MPRSRRQGLVNIIITYDQPSAARSNNPTWLNMHLTEPAITTAWIEVFPHFHWSMTTAIQATLRDSGGLTFGMVRDAACWAHVGNAIMDGVWSCAYVRDAKHEAFWRKSG